MAVTTRHKLGVTTTRDVRTYPALAPAGKNGLPLRLSKEWAIVEFRNTVAKEMRRAANDTKTNEFTTQKVDNSQGGDPLQATKVIHVTFGQVGPSKESYALLNRVPPFVSAAWTAHSIGSRTGRLRNDWQWEITDATVLTARTRVSSPQAAYPLPPRKRLFLRYNAPYAPILSSRAGQKSAVSKATKRLWKGNKTAVRIKLRSIQSVIVAAVKNIQRDPAIHASWYVRAVNQGVHSPADRKPRFIGIMFTPRRGSRITGGG